MTTKFRHDASSSSLTVLLREALRIIDEQYDVTIAFCNSQTSLLNASSSAATVMHNNRTPTSVHDDDDDNNHYPLHRILEDYDKCLKRVQENFRALQKIGAGLRPRRGESLGSDDHRNKSNNNNNPQKELASSSSSFRRVETVWKAHVERTQRILMTVQRAGGGTWSSSSYGIPLSNNDSDTVTVALATLRASVETVRDALMPLLPRESS